MKKIILLTTLLTSLQSKALWSIVCEDGNVSSKTKILINLKLNKTKTLYRDQWLPCFVDPYDGYKCDYDRPKEFTEEIIQTPADLFIISTLFGNEYKAIQVSMRRTLENKPDVKGKTYESGSLHTLDITEAMQGNDLKLNISGRMNLYKNEFYSGYEKISEDGDYVSVNTLYSGGDIRPFYLKCRGLY